MNALLHSNFITLHSKALAFLREKNTCVCRVTNIGHWVLHSWRIRNKLNRWCQLPMENYELLERKETRSWEKVWLSVLGINYPLGCIFLPESSGFLYFLFWSPVFHRNLNFCSAVILFFGIKRSKNLRSKTKASGRDLGMMPRVWYSFAACSCQIGYGYTCYRADEATWLK